jgi:hypothetical protein
MGYSLMTQNRYNRGHTRNLGLKAIDLIKANVSTLANADILLHSMAIVQCQV